MRASPAPRSRIPVSYTHLDVYKRQALQRNEAAAQQIAENAAAYDAAMERCAVAEDVYRTCLLYTSRCV